MRLGWDQPQQQQLKAVGQLCLTTRLVVATPLWEEVSVPFIGPYYLGGGICAMRHPRLKLLLSEAIKMVGVAMRT